MNQRDLYILSNILRENRSILYFDWNKRMKYILIKNVFKNLQAKILKMQGYIFTEFGFNSSK